MYKYNERIKGRKKLLLNVLSRGAVPQCLQYIHTRLLEIRFVESYRLTRLVNRSWWVLPDLVLVSLCLGLRQEQPNH